MTLLYALKRPYYYQSGLGEHQIKCECVKILVKIIYPAKVDNVMRGIQFGMMMTTTKTRERE